MPLVRLDNVAKTFRRGPATVVHAVNGVSLTIEPGETLALIGESGSGKSTVGRLVLRLFAPDSGAVIFAGQDLADLDKRSLRAIRARMTVVFQEPYQSLNPRQRIGYAVEEPLAIHEPALSVRARRARVVEALGHVALDESFYNRFPHELSGGQQQRVGIARAIVTRPAFVVLDEPTSSLDLSVRAQILQLLADLQTELNLAYLFISHDMQTVEYVSDHIAVMYLGQVVEAGDTSAVFAAPQHPYTQALISAVLSPDPAVTRDRFALTGEIPDPTEMPSGCYFFARCPMRIPECARERVPLHAYDEAHEVACIRVPGVDQEGVE